MKKFIILFSFLALPFSIFAQPRPKLVVGIVIDQMRWDYLYRFYDEYTDGGFRRLLNEGFSCDNCEINYVPSITAIGHTSVFTGSVPSIHGIAGNNILINGKETYCCNDTTVKTVGSDTNNGQRSPRNLLSTTIGDELRIATNWKSRVIGVSFKDRAAIFPAGNGANAAYWFDSKALRFISSTYYMNQLPDWVNDYNKRIGKEIESLNKNKKDKDTRTIDLIQYEPYGNEITVGMAQAAIENERLGQQGECDMLTLSFSCTDITGHQYGTHGEKTHAQYIELDKQLAKFFQYLDNKIGRGQYLVFLTADHGAANSIQLLQEHNLPAGDFNAGELKKHLNEQLNSILTPHRGQGGLPLVTNIMDYKVVLDHQVVAQEGINETKLKEVIVSICQQWPNVMYAVDLERVQQSSIPALIREKIINGYHHERSGDVQLVLKPQHFGAWKNIGYGTTHGLWNSYDCHIPFVLMGWGITHGSTKAECHITDIAPTVCAIINIQKPNGTIGNPVVQVTQ